MGAISGSGASLGTLWIEIQARVDEAVRSLQGFSSETGRIIEEQKGKFDKLADVGKSMTSVGASLTAGLTLPLAGIGAAATNAAGNFEASLNKIKAVSGTTGAELDQLRQQAMKLGADTKFSAQEAAEGMGNLAAAGLNTTQIVAAMPGVLDLAAAGELEVARAAEVTTDTLSQFGLSADQAGRVADVFAKGAAASSISVAQMADSMKYAGPIAKSAGMSIEETATAVALLGNAGIKGEQAGTSLRGMISSLVSPSKQAAEALEGLGVKTTDAAGKMLPLDNIFQQLKTSSASTADMFQIFDNASASAAATLTGVAGPAWASMTKEINNSQGAAKSMADTLNTGMKGAWEQMKGSLDTVLIALGQSLLPILTNLIQVGTKFVNDWILPAVEAFGKLDPTVQAVIIGFAALAAGIGPLLVIAGQLAGAIVSISTALPVASAAVSAFTKLVGISMGQIALYTGGILLAVGAIYKMYSAVQDLDKAEADLAKARDTTNKSLARTEAYLKSQGAAVDMLKKQLADGHITQLQYEQGLQKMAIAIGKGKKAAEEVKKPLTELEQLQAQLKVATDKAAGAIDNQGKVAKKTAAEFKPLHERSALLDAMASQLEANYRKLASQVAAAKLAAADMTRQTELLIPPTQELTDLVARSNTEFKNLAKVHVPEAVQALGQAKTSTDAITNATDGLDTGLKKVGSTSKEVADNSKLNLDSMKRSWETFGTEVSTIVTNFTQDIAKSLFEGDASWGEKAKGMLKSLGEAVTSSFIQPATAALTSFINGAIADLLGGKGFGGILDGIKGIGSAFGGLFGGAKDVAGAAGDIAGGVGGAAGSAGQIGGAIAGSAVSAIGGLVTGAVSAVTGVIGAFQMAGMNKSLDLVVKHTLQTANDMANLRRDEWDRFTGGDYTTMGRMGELLNELRIIQPDVSLARMSIQAIEGNIGAGRATLEAMLNLDRDTAQQQKTLTEVMIERLDRLAMGFERLLGLTEKQITMNLYGTDPTLVESKIAGSARLQGVLS